MPSRKNVAILVLSLTTVAATTVAWQQYQELIQLRVAVTESRAPSTNVGSFGHANALLPENGSNDAPPTIAADESDPTPGPVANASARPRGNRREGAAEFRAMMERPEIQQLMAIREKSELDSRYSDLFRSLSLSPDQLERFKELLVEKRTAVGDVRSAAREQGLNARRDPAAIDKLVADARAEVDQSIRETLGESAYAKYENYEKTQAQRTVVNQLERRLSYSTTPLSSQQTDQMVAILAGNTQGISFDVGGPFAGRGMTQITDATINQALGVLAAPQIEALRQLQKEQQAQSALNAAMRERTQSFRNSGPPPSSGTSPNVAPVPQPVSRSGG